LKVLLKKILFAQFTRTSFIQNMCQVNTMNIKITITFIVVFAGMALTTAITPSFITAASAQTTHPFCFVKVRPGSTEGLCFNTLVECQAAQANPGEGWTVTLSCFKTTNSVGHPDKFCFNFLPIPSGAACFDSLQECQSNRAMMLAGTTGGRVGSECFRNHS
jgi:hypothetical protein